MCNVRKIDLWFWRLDRPADDIARWRRHLSADERERMARFKFAQDQARFTICRFRMRRILGWYLGLGPSEIAFTTIGRNKPSLANAGAGLGFNLTHTDGLACLAVAHGDSVGAAVGLDLERVRDVKDDFVAYALNPAEHEQVLELEGEARRKAFFRFWTAKEAYLKATGTGLWQSLKTFDVDVPVDGPRGEFAPGSLPRIDDASEEARNCQLYSFRATEMHIGALAVLLPADNEIRIRTRWIDSEPWC